MLYALVLLCLAAIGGLVMVWIRARTGHNPPTGIAAAHGIAAISGSVVLAVLATRYGVLILPTASITVLVFAIVAGFVMLTKFHWQQEPIPLGLAATHGIVALVGIGILVVALLTGPEGQLDPTGEEAQELSFPAHEPPPGPSS